MTWRGTMHTRRYRFASPAEARERAKATLLDPSNAKEHVRLTYMMECICVLRMCRQVCVTVLFGVWCVVGRAGWAPAAPRPTVGPRGMLVHISCYGRALCSAPRVLAEPKGEAEEECVRRVSM